MLNYKRYKRVPVVNFPERTWPNKEIEKAPVWCSVDLRDGTNGSRRKGRDVQPFSKAGL